MPNVTPAARDLAGFNALSPSQAEHELLTCCASPVFAREVAAGRPYADPARLADVAEAVARALPWPQVLTALTAHPRIGGRVTGQGRESSWSRAEQSGTAGAGRLVLAGLATGTARYEERFGHVYLVCASGLPAGELLDRLERRLRNDEETERAIVRDELAKIARLRVAKLLEEPLTAAGNDEAGR